jgi:hypothetical protein
MTWRAIGDVAHGLVDRLRCDHDNTRIVWTEYSDYGIKYQRPQL